MLTLDQRQIEQKLMVVLRSMRSQEHLQVKDQCLSKAYRQGEIVFGAPNLPGWSYRLCSRPATIVIIDALVGVAPAFPWFCNFFLGDSFTISCASKDSRSIMRGSDVVHCV